MHKNQNVKSKYQKWLFRGGLLLFSVGIVTLGYFAYCHFSRQWYQKQLMEHNIVFSVPELEIAVPVLEGTSQEVLAVAAGHFEHTGTLGTGNYCIAGHSSTIYAYMFNHLSEAKPGMELLLYSADKTECYCYEMTGKITVNPEDTWVLWDFSDDRITVITCNDDGTQREVITGKFIKSIRTENAS